MKSFMRCKACGFVINKSKLEEVCPACGLAKIVFEEFKDRISQKRRFILEFDLHPLAVHFTQTLGIGLFLISISVLIFRKSIEADFLIISKWFCYFLPLSILLTILLGLFDASIRFKKISSPFLKLKIKLSLILLFITCINAISVYFLGVENNIYYLVGISSIIVILEAILGRTGAKLMSAVING